jgi:hypothetical protein
MGKEWQISPPIFGPFAPAPTIEWIPPKLLAGTAAIG